MTLPIKPSHIQDCQETFAMISNDSSFRRMAVFVGLLLCTSVASAHTGHGTSGIAQGLAHPFGLDHLLAMLAVGVWSVSALPASKSWWGPVTFMTALIVSAVAGASGLTLPYLEHMVALSVVLFGFMLTAARFRVPASIGLALTALAGCLHGLAHGSETPASGFAAYAAGFLLATAALHAGGMLAGMGIRTFMARQATLTSQILGMLCGGAGMYLFQSV
jgi:urease accessory protein